MIDIETQVCHWRSGGQEDWGVASELISCGRVRHGLFFANLALEKLIEVHVCRHTQDLAPRLHNLVRLAELAGLNPVPEQLDTLAEMNEFNIEARYPDYAAAPPTHDEALAIMTRAKEIMEWLAAAS